MPRKKKSFFSSFLSYTLIFTLLISNILETGVMSWAQADDDFFTEFEAIEYMAEEVSIDSLVPESAAPQEIAETSEATPNLMPMQESDDFLEDIPWENQIEQMPETLTDLVEAPTDNNIEVSAKSPEMTLIYKDEKTTLHIQAEIPEGAFETANPVKLDVTDLKKEEFDLLRTLVYRMDLELEDMPLYTARIRFLDGEEELTPAKPVELQINLPDISWSQEGFLLFRCEEKEGKVDKESAVKAIKEEKELKKETEFTSDWKERFALEQKGEKLNQITLLMKEGGVFSFYRKAEKSVEVEETETENIENEIESIETDFAAVEEITDAETETEVEASDEEEIVTDEEAESETSEEETTIEEETEGEPSEEATVEEETEEEPSEEEATVEETEEEPSEEETTEEETEDETSEEETTVEEETEDEIIEEETSEFDTEEAVHTVLTYEDAETGLRIEAEILEGTFETENPVELKVSALNPEDLEQIKLFAEQNLADLEELPCFSANIYFTDGEQEVIPANPIDICIWLTNTEWSENSFAAYRYEPENEEALLTEIQNREELDLDSEWNESVLPEESEEKLSQITLSVKEGGAFVLYRKATEEEFAEETELFRTFFWENEDVSITISGELGAFPETMDHVSVTPVVAENEETAAQYEEVSEHLQNKAEEEEYSIAGFLAYDISLRDPDDNELEPNAPISVSIEYHNAVIPEEVQNTLNDLPVDEEYSVDVTVMHLVENEEGVVETVENLADEDNSGEIINLEVNEENQIEKAEFTAESFSLYTITWNVAEAIDNFKFVRNKQYIIYIANYGKYYALGINPWNNQAQTMLLDSLSPQFNGTTTSVDLRNVSTEFLWEFVSDNSNKGRFKSVRTGKYLKMGDLGSNFSEDSSDYSANEFEYSGKRFKCVTNNRYLNFNDGTKSFNTQTGSNTWDILIAEVNIQYDGVETVQTVDSRSDGIRLNLFDYSGSELDSSNNTYNSTKNVGINSVNSKLKFFGYGTPLSDKNRGQYDNFAKDTEVYNLNVSGNAWEGDGSGNKARAVQGIVKDKLEGGYPVLVDGNTPLSYLFDLNETSYKKVYADVNNLFVSRGESSYYFNSNDYYAHYTSDKGGGDFELTHYLNDGKWQNYIISSNLNTETTVNAGFFPFNNPDTRQTSVNFDVYYNHHFGMTMDADFYLPPHRTLNGEENGKHIVYEFSGDDDMWVYVDGVLILDIGGIHEPITGKIDFTTGEVYISNATKVGTKGVGKEVRTTLQELFQDAGEVWDPKPYSTHDVKAFYLERGGIYSNLKLTIDLPTFVPVRFQKDISKNDKGILDGNEQYRFIAYTSATEQYDLPALRPAAYTAENAANLVKYKDSWYEIVSPEKVWNEAKSQYDYIFTTGAGEANQLMFLTGGGKRLHHMEEVKTDTNLFKMKYSTDGGATYTEGTLSGDASTNPTSSSVSTGAFATNPDKITVDNELKHIDIPVEKRWEEEPSDSNFKVKVWLYEDDVKTEKSLELTKNGNWKGTFTDLPKYRKDATCGYAEIQYSVQEEINGYYPEYTEEEIGGVITKVITNYSNPTSLNLVKYGESGTDSTLTGAKFKLEKRIVQGDTEDWSLVTDAKNGSTSADGIYEVTGEVEFDKLLPGIYRLTETTAPAGYMLLSDSIYFKVAEKRITLVELDSTEYKSVTNKTREDSWWLTNDTIQLLNIRNTPYRSGFDILKTDDQGTKLGGVTFKLEAVTITGETNSPFSDEKTTAVNETEADGKIRFENLRDGTYTLTETVVPDAYEKLMNPITITIDQGVITVPTLTPAEGETPAYSWNENTLLLTVVNPRKVYPLKITKVNSLNETQLLAGAEFSFYSDSACTVIAKDASGAYIEVQTTGSAGENKGIITLQNLLPGTYYIKETKAPIGFTLITETLTVTILNDGSLSAVGILSNGVVDNHTIRIHEPEGITDITEWKSTDGIIITNCPLYSLPSSGGTGIYMYMMLGMVLMLGAAWINIKNKRRGVLKSIR